MPSGHGVLTVLSLFYRATLCVSAVLAVGRCPVYLSNTFMYCIETAKDIITLSSRPGSPIIPFFSAHSALHNARGTPSCARALILVEWEIALFGQCLAIAWKRNKIGLRLLGNVNKNSYVPDRSVSVPMTLKGRMPGLNIFDGCLYIRSLRLTNSD